MPGPKKSICVAKSAALRAVSSGVGGTVGAGWELEVVGFGDGDSAGSDVHPVSKKSVATVKITLMIMSLMLTGG
jgi:hypothetical protein